MIGLVLRAMSFLDFDFSACPCFIFVLLHSTGQCCNTVQFRESEREERELTVRSVLQLLVFDSVSIFFLSKFMMYVVSE